MNLIRHSNVFGSHFSTDCKILHLKKICRKIYVSLLHIVAAEHLTEPPYAHRKFGTAEKKKYLETSTGFAAYCTQTRSLSESLLIGTCGT